MRTGKAIRYAIIITFIWLIIGGSIAEGTGSKVLGWLTFFPILVIALWYIISKGEY